MPDFKPYLTQLNKLGSRKTTVTRLHIKRLSDLDLEVGLEIVSPSARRMHELNESISAD